MEILPGNVRRDVSGRISFRGGFHYTQKETPSEKVRAGGRRDDECPPSPNPPPCNGGVFLGDPADFFIRN